jgi:glucose uptake protein GlcU
MIINWLTDNPVIIGLTVFLLMLLDRFLTVIQEKERKKYYFKHYESYP